MRGFSLITRLFLAQVLVVLVGAATLAVVAASVGPPIFRDHVRRLNGLHGTGMMAHLEDAYASASTVALTVAVIASLIAALATSAFVARRVARPIEQLAAATAHVAHGRYGVRVPSPALGAEFDTVASAFNAMARRLGEVESTRTRLLADLAHEMRTPLATIEAYLDAAEDGVAVEGQDTLSVLRAQTGRLRRLGEDIAAVSHAEENHSAVQRTRISPNEPVRTALAGAHEAYTAKGVTLRQTTADAVPDIDADPERLGQVLGNLLDNALRHTAAGGEVTVAVSTDGPHVLIAVRDTGEGIAAEHLPHVFERFYRADTARDRRHGGAGIGLAIVRALVEQHGGHVTAHSDGTGTGSTFTVRLPAPVVE